MGKNEIDLMVLGVCAGNKKRQAAQPKPKPKPTKNKKTKHQHNHQEVEVLSNHTQLQLNKKHNKSERLIKER